MKLAFVRWAALVVIASFSGPALAQVSEPGDVRDTEACVEVMNQFRAGATAESVIRARMAGRSLLEATVFTLVCGGESNRVAVARAGVGLAGNLAEAQTVGYGLLRTAGETGPVSVAVDEALQGYVERMSQPGIHEDGYTPHGGSVSPST